MLNRRQIRIKALQTVYAHFQSGSDDLAATEKTLKMNMDKLYDLYIWQLSFLIEIIDFAEARIEENRNKYLPTEDDIHPNTRFVHNRFIKQLRQNIGFQTNYKRLKINWGGEDELFRKAYNELKDSDYYKAYMNDDYCTYQNDKDIIAEFVRKVMVPNDVLRDFFEEKYFLWSEDYFMALAFVLHTISFFKEEWKPEYGLFPLYKPVEHEDEGDDDEIFLKKLVRTTIIKSDEFDEIIKKKTMNWEFERIATMDLILLRMGMAEIFYFDSIPLKVTLNEIIELAKHFSSPKSKVFINGLLDRTIEEGLKSGTVAKRGRGLIGQ